MNLKSTVKAILSVGLAAVFFRIFIISVYSISTTEMSPLLIPGDILIANQWSYGVKFPWQQAAYFSSEPQMSDTIVYKQQKSATESIFIKQIVNKTDTGYLVKADSEASVSSISRDQIIGKAWFVALSIGTTQDSISAEKSIRWNRFLTMIH
jgi:signal peptidase I